MLAVLAHILTTSISLTPPFFEFLPSKPIAGPGPRRFSASGDGSWRALEQSGIDPDQLKDSRSPGFMQA